MSMRPTDYKGTEVTLGEQAKKNWTMSVLHFKIIINYFKPPETHMLPYHSLYHLYVKQGSYYFTSKSYFFQSPVLEIIFFPLCNLVYFFYPFPPSPSSVLLYVLKYIAKILPFFLPSVSFFSFLLFTPLVLHQHK